VQRSVSASTRSSPPARSVVTCRPRSTRSRSTPSGRPGAVDLGRAPPTSAKPPDDGRWTGASTRRPWTTTARATACTRFSPTTGSSLTPMSSQRTSASRPSRSASTRPGGCSRSPRCSSRTRDASRRFSSSTSSPFSPRRSSNASSVERWRLRASASCPCTRRREPPADRPPSRSSASSLSRNATHSAIRIAPSAPSIPSSPISSFKSSTSPACHQLPTDAPPHPRDHSREIAPAMCGMWDEAPVGGRIGALGA